MANVNYVASDHLQFVVRPDSWNLTIKNLIGRIQESGVEFDSIAFRGASGCLVAPAVAGTLNKQMLMVRKPNDGSHSSRTVEGNWGTKRYIIIDDLTDTWDTVKAMLRDVNYVTKDSQCVGIFLYGSWQRDSKEKITYRPSPLTEKTVEIPIYRFDIMAGEKEGEFKVKCNNSIKVVKPLAAPNPTTYQRIRAFIGL